MIILARMEESGLRETGRIIECDRNMYPEMETFSEPHSLMYSNKEQRGDLEKALRFAADEGYEVYQFPAGTKNPLEQAQLLLEMDKQAN